uniref:Reverse transcriptase Ty1/copia-type domain-containing protein n=1 Tax=Trichuris muris TaxID=70415 RepID=A0A5S6Q3I8_TRIMR
MSQRGTKGHPPRRFGFDAECYKVQDPSSMDDVFQLPPHERRLWMQAAAREIKSMQKLHVWDLVDLPPGKKPISLKWVFKVKPNSEGQADTYKARLVARGFSQRYGEDYDETFAPVVKHDTVRVLLSLAAAQKLHVRHLDVKAAYLNSPLEEELYVKQPPGFEVQGQEHKVLLLRKSLYGLKQSARAWNKMATDTLTSLGFEQAMADHCLFSKKEKNGSRTYILIYVDDLLVVGATPKITKEVGIQMDKFFQTKDLGEVKNYLGIQIEREGDGSILLHQRNKIEQLLEQYGLMECKPAPTPMETGFLSVNQESPPMPDNTKYRQAIGSLLYVATVSRPDIAAPVGFLCRHVEKPTEADWKAVKRVMRYLAATKYMTLRLSSAGGIDLQCYVDADWAGDKADRKSTTGFVFQLGKNTVAWSSRKQSVVALSSTEAEYLAVSHACRELLWLRQLLKDLGIAVKDPTIIHEDNQACIKMVNSERYGARTKHVDVCHHHVRDLRAQGTIKLQYCPSDKMRADILTKPLCKDKFSRFAHLIGLEDHKDPKESAHDLTGAK